MESKFKVGDKCRIVNFGHLVWENKSEPIKMNLPTYCESENTRWVDLNPELIGKEVVILEVSNDGKRYSTSLFSWALEEQLELIEN